MLMARKGHFYREMELETPESGHRIGREQPSHCSGLAVDNGHNTWVCPRCGAFVQQVLRLSEMTS